MAFSTHTIGYRRLVRIPGSIFPLREAVTDNLHGRHRSVTQIGIAGNFPADPLAFATQHLANALQFEDDTVNFFHGCAGNAPNKSIQIVRHRFGLCFGFRPLTTQQSDIASDEFANFALERRRRLFGIAQFFHWFPVGSIYFRPGLFRNCAKPITPAHGQLLQGAMQIARVRFAGRLPHATWAAVGQSRACRRNWSRRISYARLFQDLEPDRAYQWTLKPALMRLLLVVWPKSLTAVVTCGGPPRLFP